MSGGTTLLDVNVMIAFLWPPHAHHQRARTWFAGAQSRSWASCPITEMGCVRLLANQAIGQGSFSIPAACELLAEFLAEEGHEFWPDDLPLSDPQLTASLPHLQGPRQLTDRYLLALAAAHAGTLATFDRALAAGLPADSPLLAHLEVIEG